MQEKREIKRQLQLADSIMKEGLYTVYYVVSGDEKIVAYRNVGIPGWKRKLGLWTKLDGDEIYEEFWKVYDDSVGRNVDKEKKKDKIWNMRR